MPCASSSPNPGLLDYFSALEDPRQSWKVVYPLEEVLLIVLSAVMAGADDFVEIGLWAKNKLGFLRRFLPFSSGVPSHDTLNDVMNALPNDLFVESFTAWVEALRQGDRNIVAIDGKTSRRAYGRIETRRAWVSHEVGWLQGNCADPSVPRFPSLSCIAMVEAEVEHKGQTSRSRRFYLSSATLNAKQLLHATRAHWGIENRLHWVMDVVFHDDLMRLRSENGPANMAVIRHTAMNLFKGIKDKNSLKNRRKNAAWNQNYLEMALKSAL